MSYMLEFPPAPLPANTSSPPYVLFGINDLHAISNLPPTIPLALALHFAPALRKWILPPPELSPAVIRMSLRTPYVGINILADMEVEGLCWILARMMQVANLKLPARNSDMYLTKPNLATCIAIHKAWTALELPSKGIEALHLHIQSSLMIGPPVILFEIKGLWHNFSLNSPVLREMGLNFMKNYCDGNYPTTESSPVRHWYLETKERHTFFQKFEKMFPGFEEVQKKAMKAAAERHRREEALFKIGREAEMAYQEHVEARKSSKRERWEKQDREDKLKLPREPKEKQDRENKLERPREPKEKESQGNKVDWPRTRERRASKRRLERAQSIESFSSVGSVETVIWNPLREAEELEDPTTPTSETSQPTSPHSTPVDSSDLFDRLLAEMVLEDGAIQERSEARQARKQDREDEKEPQTGKKHPKSASVTANDLKLKPKLKQSPDPHPKPQKFRPRHLFTKKSTQLAEKALKILSPKPSSEAVDGTTQLATKGPLATAAEFLSPTPSAKDLHGENSTNELPSHEKILAEISYVNDALTRRASREALEDGEAAPVHQLEDSISIGNDGLVYLQPSVYRGPH